MFQTAKALQAFIMPQYQSPWQLFFVHIYIYTQLMFPVVLYMCTQICMHECVFVGMFADGHACMRVCTYICKDTPIWKLQNISVQIQRISNIYIHTLISCAAHSIRKLHITCTQHHIIYSLSESEQYNDSDTYKVFEPFPDARTDLCFHQRIHEIHDKSPLRIENGACFCVGERFKHSCTPQTYTRTCAYTLALYILYTCVYIYRPT